jgi:predicted nucleic acid-binding Zn ribbon protein
MSYPNRRGPRALSDVLGELFTVRGYGRLRAVGAMEEAWNTAVGQPQCNQTRVGELRRGVLNVTVAHPTLLAELAAFRKPELLEALRASAPGIAIHDIRFRVGSVESPAPGGRDDPPPPSGVAPGGNSTTRPNPSSGPMHRPRDRRRNHKRSAGEG